MNRLRTEVHDILIDAVNNGITDDAALDYAIRTAAKVVEKVAIFVDKNGDIALSCGSEWLYQSDKGQETALALVGDVLDYLNVYASNEDSE